MIGLIYGQPGHAARDGRETVSVTESGRGGGTRADSGASLALAACALASPERVSPEIDTLQFMRGKLMYMRGMRGTLRVHVPPPWALANVQLTLDNPLL